MATDIMKKGKEIHKPDDDITVPVFMLRYSSQLLVTTAFYVPNKDNCGVRVLLRKLGCLQCNVV